MVDTSVSEQFVINKKHCRPIEKILIIEDSLLLLNTLKNALDQEFHIDCDIAANEKEATHLLKINSYDLVIADIYLPDSSGNFIGYLIRKKHRILVITASQDETRRTKIASLPIVDYLYKTDEKSTLNYLINSIRRLQKNINLPVMICDDSNLSRLQLAQLVVQQNLPYICVKDGQEAYDCIIKHKTEIALLITDVIMPRMDGCDLIRHIRHKYTSNELPILALSASKKSSIVAQLLKIGANDYVHKPINNEEFLTRINISLDQSRLYLENRKLIDILQKMSETDFLTKLYNRSHFHKTIKSIQAQAKRNKSTYGIIMLDIDHFKSVNDTYGHETGDIALVSISKILLETARESDTIYRWGGEEFLILVQNTNEDELYNFAQRMRQIIKSTSISVPNTPIEFTVTISIGIALSTSSNINNAQNIIYNADQKLYQAKTRGRDCVVKD
ncbi:MAG: diguanylate cyclase (GGDEF)-like protein [Sulfurimonas sp.]|jgi:diguanylate cyclase (GGDEF)-like protein|uniref:GGDEF domain-containing response regulator n=1 Tax=Sulfurimonas sp. TaxID=2022749 RepID=UPI0039E26F10